MKGPSSIANGSRSCVDRHWPINLSIATSEARGGFARRATMTMTTEVARVKPLRTAGQDRRGSALAPRSEIRMIATELQQRSFEPAITGCRDRKRNSKRQNRQANPSVRPVRACDMRKRENDVGQHGMDEIAAIRCFGEESGYPGS